jgi:hypothetical protein
MAMIVSLSRLPWTPVNSARSVSGRRVARESSNSATSGGVDRDRALAPALGAAHPQQAAKLGAVEHVGERLALLGCAQHGRGVALELLVLRTEAKEALQRRHRARLGLTAPGGWSARRRGSGAGPGCAPRPARLASCFAERPGRRKRRTYRRGMSPGRGAAPPRKTAGNHRVPATRQLPSGRPRPASANP